MSDEAVPEPFGSLAPELAIYRASNGWLVRSPDDTIAISEPKEMDTTIGLLQEVAYRLGLQGGRYDARRLSIGWQPGDKHHDDHPEPCAECECKCEPDRGGE